MIKQIMIPENLEAVEVFGAYNNRLKHLKKIFNINFNYENRILLIESDHESDLDSTYNIISELIEILNENHLPDWSQFLYIISRYNSNDLTIKKGALNSMKDIINTTIKGVKIVAKTEGQSKYIKDLQENEIVFSIGPAGTGKTYLAVAMAVDFLKSGKVQKIILTRPAVEAGEKLGFLPGDLQDKVDPYLRPLYDSLTDFLGLEKLDFYREKGVIEVVPLAYMRGRTLNNAFIILDEAQNTTYQQMKMFLTRIGFDSKVVVTGDITQIDLEKKKDSGLLTVTKFLKNIKGIKFSYLNNSDVVRNPLVKKIISAYEKYENNLE
ncbi:MULTISPECIES: PhoH family protein [Oceanotoga]